MGDRRKPGVEAAARVIGACALMFTVGLIAATISGRGDVAVLAASFTGCISALIALLVDPNKQPETPSDDTVEGG